jgi:predicted P-loop ATPase
MTAAKFDPDEFMRGVAEDVERVMPEQAARYEPDAWEDNIREFLAAHKPERVTIGQIAREVLHIDTPKIGTAEQRRIAAALEILEWRRGKRGDSGERWWVKLLTH